MSKETIIPELNVQAQVDAAAKAELEKLISGFSEKAFLESLSAGTVTDKDKMIFKLWKKAEDAKAEKLIAEQPKEVQLPFRTVRVEHSGLFHKANFASALFQKYSSAIFDYYGPGSQNIIDNALYEKTGEYKILEKKVTPGFIIVRGMNVEEAEVKKLLALPAVLKSDAEDLELEKLTAAAELLQKALQFIDKKPDSELAKSLKTLLRFPK